MCKSTPAKFAAKLQKIFYINKLKIHIFMKGFKSEHTLWKIVDSHWVNVSREFISYDGTTTTTAYNGTLADYMWLIRIEIPEYINYCLAQNDEIEMKFRKHGGQINIYIHPVH